MRFTSEYENGVGATVGVATGARVGLKADGANVAVLGAGVVGTPRGWPTTSTREASPARAAAPLLGEAAADSCAAFFE